MATSGICALCRLEGKLQRSHILPEFLYDRLYDDLHSYPVVSVGAAARSPRRKTGIYERLLCEYCDRGRLGKLDDYAATVLKGRIELEFTDKPDRLIISSVNYTTFKLWQMSLLWRCGVSKRPEFGATQLGPHAENLRSLLLSADLGRPHEYGCIVMLASSHDVTKEFIMPPEPITIHGHRCYRAVFGGLWWFFVVSSHSATFPFQEDFLQESGVLSIPKESTYSSEFVLKLGRDLGAF